MKQHVLGDEVSRTYMMGIRIKFTISSRYCVDQTTPPVISKLVNSSLGERKIAHAIVLCAVVCTAHQTTILASSLLTPGLLTGIHHGIILQETRVDKPIIPDLNSLHITVHE